MTSQLTMQLLSSRGVRKQFFYEASLKTPSVLKPFLLSI